MFWAGVALARMGVVPRGANDSRPSHITAVRNRRFVAGGGRRKSESCVALAKPYGSSTFTSANSAPAGTGKPIRITPLLSNMLNACFRAWTVETSAFGEFEPSTVRKMGSSPAVNANRSWTSGGVIVQADEVTWQEEQDLPLVPRLWKNGFDRSSGLPSSVMVRSTPDGSRVSIVFGWPLASVAEANEMATASVQTPKQRPS